MLAFYTLFISFTLVLFSELGDKTQLLVLSFATKNRAKNILLGVAIGSFFSHGIAIVFGSYISNLDIPFLNTYLKYLTYITFIVFGIFSLIPKETKNTSISNKDTLISKLCYTGFNVVFIVALSIIIGELGDKTFLASMGLGLEYPNYKFFLILGSVFGMVVSNGVAILFGKILENKVSTDKIEKFSGILFILFGMLGLIF